jgi:Coenzyme PQQ synthesis protein D (PqqD).
MVSSVRIRQGVQSVIDPDGAVLLDLVQGTYFGLSEVAAEIWSQLEAGHTLSEVEGHLCEVFSITPDVARSDLADFVQELARRELVDVRD